MFRTVRRTERNLRVIIGLTKLSSDRKFESTSERREFVGESGLLRLERRESRFAPL